MEFNIIKNLEIAKAGLKAIVEESNDTLIAVKIAKQTLDQIEETLEEAHLKEFTYYVEELESIKDEKKYLSQFSNLNPDDDMYELMKKWKEHFNNKKT